MIHPTDIQVGKCIRTQRRCMGITQEQLGNAIGVKFQQVQKYETGANRVSASRLWEIAKVLNQPVTFFFDGCEDGPANPAHLARSTEEIELILDFRRLPKDQRHALRTIQCAMAEAATDSD